MWVKNNRRFSWLVLSETGRDGKIVKLTKYSCLDGTGRDGGCEFSRRDGTVQYDDLFVS